MNNLSDSLETSLVEPLLGDANLPEWSVSDLSGALKRTLEDAFGQVRVRGEISGYRGAHSSGHAYFALKDSGAKIEAVIWKGVFARLKWRPEEGMEVIAKGRVSTFPGKSSYQIIIESLEPAGIGALMALYEERKRRLQAQGLFEAARKRPLPYLPEVIGIITSPTGAVIRDMIHRLEERFPRLVLLWPVRVQGEGSAAEIAAAIAGFNAIDPQNGDLPRPDVIIVARGGGSLEDLWSFNEEIVVQAAALSQIPLISAIGHETDWSLLDLVADKRAPTPSAAAEMVVPVRADLLISTREKSARLVLAWRRLFERNKRDCAQISRILATPERLIEPASQRLDRVVMAWQHQKDKYFQQAHMRLRMLNTRLGAQKPAAKLERMKERLRAQSERLTQARTKKIEYLRQEGFHLSARLQRAQSARFAIEKRGHQSRSEAYTRLSQRLPRAIFSLLRERGQRVEKQAQWLHSLGYQQVLKRGYALVRDGETRALIRSADEMLPLNSIQIEFAGGVSSILALRGEGALAPRLSSPAFEAAPPIETPPPKKTTKRGEKPTEKQADFFETIRPAQDDR